MKKVILASASLRRSQILYSCGICHEVRPSRVEEICESSGGISEIVQFNAVKKAEHVAKDAGEAVIISADTMVAHEGDHIGKPENEKEAREMLMRFSGSSLSVYTGVCVINMPEGRKACKIDTSGISVVNLTEGEVDRYFGLLGPYDKAGGFSIEGVGSILFDDIKGSYFNILGLSMVTVKELFSEVGEDILDFIEVPGS